MFLHLSVAIFLALALAPDDAQSFAFEVRGQQVTGVAMGDESWRIAPPGEAETRWIVRRSGTALRVTSSGDASVVRITDHLAITDQIDWSRVEVVETQADGIQLRIRRPTPSEIVIVRVEGERETLFTRIQYSDAPPAGSGQGAPEGSAEGPSAPSTQPSP